MDDHTRHQLIFPTQDAPMRLLCPHCETPALQPYRVSVNQQGSGEQDISINLGTLNIIQVKAYPEAIPCLMVGLECLSCHRRSALSVMTDTEKGSMISLRELVSVDGPDEGEEEDER